MKRILLIGGLTAALALTGCASAPDENYVPPTEEERAQEASDGFIVIRKNLGDGRIVICVTNELAISCDWGNTE